MPKETWMIACGLTIALLLGLLGYASWQKKSEVEQLRKDLAAAQAAAIKSATVQQELKEQLEKSEGVIGDLEKEKEAALQSRKGLEDEMRAKLESKDVAISQLQGKLTVTILDRVLFDSGEAELKPDGGTVLRKVAAVLSQHPELKIHVVGHTDNVPIRASARSRFASNWELSTARATAAVRFLTESAGVDPHRVGAVGYGEFRPVADNSTAEGRARNRRIALTILTDEMAGADAPAPPEPPPATAGTNAAVSPVSGPPINAPGD
jgi:chemotaxis protein MotB